MAMDLQGRIYDYFGGQQDLQRRLLRTVGDPAKRYAEDALRMFRACRFVAQLDFTYVEGEAAEAPGADAAPAVAPIGDGAATGAAKEENALLATPDGAAAPVVTSPEGVAGNAVTNDYGRENAVSTPAAYVNAQAGQSLTAMAGIDGPLPRECWPVAGQPFGEPGTPYLLERRVVFDTRRCAELSRERVKKEMEKLLLGKAAGKGLMLMLATGLLHTYCKARQDGRETQVPVLPELEHLYGLRQNLRYHCYNTLEHTLLALDNSERKLEIRWAMVLHDIGKGLQQVRQVRADGSPSDHGHEAVSAAMTPGILRRFGYAPAFIRRVTWLVAQHMRFAPMLFARKNTIKRWVRGEALSGTFRSQAELVDGYTQLANVFLSDMSATWAGVRREPVVEDGRALTREAIELARTRMPVVTSDLAVRGRDILPLLREAAGDVSAMASSSETAASGDSEACGEAVTSAAREKMVAADGLTGGAEATGGGKRAGSRQSGGNMQVGDALKYLLMRVQMNGLPNEREALLTALETKLRRQRAAQLGVENVPSVTSAQAGAEAEIDAGTDEKRPPKE